MEATRAVNRFEVISEYVPSGDQPEAIRQLAARINAGETDVVLLGATGTGKSATTAWLIEQVQRPTRLRHEEIPDGQLQPVVVLAGSEGFEFGCGFCFFSGFNGIFSS